ncbi:nuclease-related domain-containing protein [Pseudoalteromonas sp. MTN2-4]|uniref:nuclease-related domain-containing protein n=1 Tax=Pseudoalteromonas sp. MTN2-4 TaxID=3056555 RepID=UPI0036F208ED
MLNRIALFFFVVISFTSIAFKSNLSYEQCARFYKEYQSIAVKMDSATGVALQSLGNRYGRLQERLEAFCQDTEFSNTETSKTSSSVQSESQTQRLFSDDIKQQAWEAFYTAPSYCLSNPLSSINKLRCNNELSRFKELFEQQWQQNKDISPTQLDTEPKEALELERQDANSKGSELNKSPEKNDTSTKANLSNQLNENSNPKSEQITATTHLATEQNYQTTTTGLDTLFYYAKDYLYLIILLLLLLLSIKYIFPSAKKLFTRHFSYVAVNKYLMKHLSVDDYTLYSKISLPIPSGMADIDELVLSPYGIFVIICQSQTGRIYADTTSEVWSEQIGKDRNNFPNPSRQLPMKLVGVKQLFGIEEHIHGLIVFDQEADFRTNMPNNVFHTGQLLANIEHYEDKVFTKEQISHFVLLLSEYKPSNPFKDILSKIGDKSSQNSEWES